MQESVQGPGGGEGRGSGREGESDVCCVGWGQHMVALVVRDGVLMNFCTWYVWIEELCLYINCLPVLYLT